MNTVAGWLQLLQYGQSVLVLLVGVVVWFWLRQQKAEKELLDGRFARIDERQQQHEEDLKRRVEDINDRLSTRLLPCVQELGARLDRMPEDLRSKFLPLDRAMDLIEESRRDRAAIWNELQKRGGRGHPR